MRETSGIAPKADGRLPAARLRIASPTSLPDGEGMAAPESEAMPADAMPAASDAGDGSFGCLPAAAALGFADSRDDESSTEPPVASAPPVPLLPPRLAAVPPQQIEHGASPSVEPHDSVAPQHPSVMW